MNYDSQIWSAAPPVIGPGTRLNGIYEIDHAIGSGGMGDIYKGHAIETGDVVAIKIIRADMAQNEAALALFRKEASILHNLAHEAIIRYFVFSVDPAIRRPYLAMEFVDGAPLSDLLARGPLSFDEVRSLQRRMAAGLQAAHELGVVHRDISPDNVILPGGDVRRAKIIDFGIARAAKIGGETIIGGGFAGKHNYASPEQLGLFSGQVTAKSDIYSMGLVLAAALTGRPIDMDGTQVEVIEKRRSVPDLGALDARIRPLIERMLQPRPEDRPESMAAIAEWPHGSATLMPDVRSEARFTQVGAKPKVRPPEERSSSAGGVLVAVGLLAVLAASGGALVYALDLWPSGEVPFEDPVEDPAEPPLEPVELPQPPEPVEPTQPPEPVEPTQPPEPVKPTQPPEPVEPTQPPEPVEPTQPPKPVEPTQPLTRVAEVEKYVREYDGGPCFFATPLSIGETGGKVVARLEVFSSAAEPARALDTAFLKANGFEATIGVRQVMPAQCPAVEFMKHVASEPGEAPVLTLSSFELRPGAPLTGSVREPDGRHIELLLVSDTGTVTNVTGDAVSNGTSLAFSVRPEAMHAPAAKPNLLIALATREPLGLPSSSLPAGAYFPRVLVAAERSNQKIGVAVEYFKMGG